VVRIWFFKSYKNTREKRKTEIEFIYGDTHTKRSPASHNFHNLFRHTGGKGKKSLRSILSTSKALARQVEIGGERLRGSFTAAPIGDLLTIYWAYMGYIRESAILYGPTMAEAILPRFSPFSSDTRPAAAAIERGTGPLRVLIYSKRSDRHLISYTQAQPSFPGAIPLDKFVKSNSDQREKVQTYYQIDELGEVETETDGDDLRVVAHGSNQSVVMTQ
jgi:hypothetical protein